MPRPAPYGTWSSPLTADRVAAGARRIADVVVEGDTIYWGETRPDEGGRVTIMQRTPDGEVIDLLPEPWSARTRVHEYGGAAFTVADGVLYFSQFDDQRIYDFHPEGRPEPLTPDGPWRFADAVIDRERDRLLCVREDHGAKNAEPRNEIVAIDRESGAVTVLVTGRTFYASPRLSPDGRRLCWLEWDHPNMPWDGTVLCVGDVANDGKVRSRTVVAGGAEESVYGPLWSPSGVLHFASDRTGWWNLYRQQGREIVPLWPLDAEFAVPQWSFGGASFGFDAPLSARPIVGPVAHDAPRAGNARSDGGARSYAAVVCVYGPPGARRLARIDADAGRSSTPKTYELPFTELGSVRVAAGRAILTAASPTSSTALIAVDLASGEWDVLRQPSTLVLHDSDVSTPEAIAFPTTDGATAHGFFYAPHNTALVGPPGERPPLLVLSHGGPTGSASTGLSTDIQYWTSRGFGVLDVNYGGSTGYGRAYRARLDGAWGIVDVADCVNGARFLVERGDVDPARLAIRGGSAGGYTTLCALAFHEVFAAGASHYGVGDLEALAKDTHKFESRYLDRLIGPYPEQRDLYVERSPIHHVEGFACPIIFFQGLEDRVVPPAQAEAMEAALKAKGIPVAYVPFEGEQHGFRRAENITRALEAELYFYGRVLGFAPADRIAPVRIENLG
ncbi:MAG: S9 family peptidase [Ardenticatenales bacterium]|nr:S9 family peptidase [Ardenticatenales bacterium]